MSRVKTKLGFTIIEMVIVAPIVFFVIGAFITVVVKMTAESMAARNLNILTYNIQDGLDQIEQDVKLSSGFLAINSVAVATPQGYNNDTTVFKNTGLGGTADRALILNAIATTKNPLDPSAAVVYLPNTPYACAIANTTLNMPQKYNIVYFIKNNALWRRVVMASTYATDGCSVPWQQPSCAVGTTGAMCKTEDQLIVNNVTVGNFNLDYYATPNATSSDTIANDSTQTDAVRNFSLGQDSTVNATITSSTMVAGKTISRTASLRVSTMQYSAF